MDTEDIKNCFRRFGRDLDDRKIEKMIRETDILDGDKKISLSEFEAAMMLSKTQEKKIEAAEMMHHKP